MSFTRWGKLAVIAAVGISVVTATARAGLSVAIVEADGGDAPVSQLLATGLFSSVTDINAQSNTPTLAQLQGYNAILTYTNFAPANGAALGDVLKQYVDGGGGLVMATYAYSNPWAIAGGITDHGYSPLVNVGVNGGVSGNLVQVHANSIFSGIDLATLTYFNNNNFAQPGLDAGATLLATDGSGVDMIAINASGKIIGDNLFPGASYNGQPLFQLIGNELVDVSDAVRAPEPATLALLGTGLIALGVARRRRS